MKKLLLTSLLSVLIFGSTFGQFRFQSDVNIGMTYSAVNSVDKDTLLVHFNTAKPNSSYTDAAITLSKCQTQRGIQCYVYNNSTTTTQVQSGNFKGGAYTGNGNPVRVASMDSLFRIMAKSSSTPTPTNGSLQDSLTQPAHCLFDITTTNQAFGVYPGKYKHLEYAFYFSFSGKACTDDVTFEIDTYNEGTTGKTASYELAVYKSTTISDANLFAPKIADFYVTGSGKKTVNLAAAIGLQPRDFSNQVVIVFLRTQGTPNASGVVDGLPNQTTGATHIPVTYDPTIVFDNFNFMFGTSSWATPSGAVANSVFNHNNGSPVVTTSTDWSGGTAVPVYITDSTKIPIYLTGKRYGTLLVKEANDGGGHVNKFAFTPSGSLKKKNNGTFSLDVPYTYTPSDGTTAMSLLVAAPPAGLSVNDTLKLELSSVGVGSGQNAAVRLEIDNGVRFWYNVGVTGSIWTANNVIDLDKPQIWSSQSNIFVSNNTNDVQIFNVVGQKVKVAIAQEAEKGIAVKSGIYIIKTADTVQKLIVE